jgi:hypothetical protein
MPRIRRAYQSDVNDPEPIQQPDWAEGGVLSCRLNLACSREVRAEGSI